MHYRKEVFESRHNNWSGKALLVSGNKSHYVIAFTTLFFTSFLILIISCSYTRRINVTGEIVSTPRAVTVFSTQQGFIVDKKVEQGERVIRGQPLYLIDVSHRTTSGVVGKLHHESIYRRLQTLKRIEADITKNRDLTLAMLSEEKTRYEAAQNRSSAVLNKAREGLLMMKENMDNYKQYQRRGLINRDQLLNQSAMYYQQQNEMLGIESQNEQNALQIMSLRTSLQTQATSFDNELNQISIQKNALESELTDADAGSEQIIVSPIDGTVDTISITQGQAVSSGDSLLQIIPGKAHYRTLVLWVPDSAMPYLSVGQDVNISYDAFPAQKFGQFPGKITSLAHSPSSIQEMSSYPGAPQHSSDDQHTWYKVVVTPFSEHFNYKNKKIRAENGMKASVTLFLEERKLYQWIISPFYDVRYSVKGAIHE